MKVMLQLDVENCFLTILRQIVFDMVAGKASVDYPNTTYKKGDPLPTHPSFVLLYHLVSCCMDLLLD
jgi:hypothetical protein